MADEPRTPAEETEAFVTPPEGEGPEVIISGEVEEPTPGLVEVEVEAEEYVPERAPREKPAVPGADLEVDIVPEGVDPLAGANIDPYAEYDQDDAAAVEELEDVVVAAPIEAVAIDLGAGARYRATGKRKSAIARVTLRPGKGEYTINGRSLSELSSEELARYRRHSVGIVFQAFNLVPSMTVAENVELPLRLAETERRDRAGRVGEALDRVGLSPRLAHRPGELSGGEQQRVALARALVNSPRILLADEPTGNLDSHTGMEIMELIRDCNRRLGMTVLLVTHERALAERYARRLLFLADGKLVEDQPILPFPGESAVRP